MPFYKYNCSSCNKEFKSMHGSDEIIDTCQLCGSSNITKALGNIRSINLPNVASTAGTRVEQFIEESRASLQEQLQEARKEYK
jgi:putative FmdB family regulatory protein